MSYDHWVNAQKVVVIGAGTMGSGIAAHLANLGFDVSLLDISQDNAEQAFKRARSARPPHFFVPETGDRIRLGSIATNLEWISEADWVCEAIYENLEAKIDLFSRVEPYLKPDAMISTNTSGLQIDLLTQGRSESFKRRFLGTHFFNPPRYLKLLELIPTDVTDSAAIASMTSFLESRVARRVVVAKDTPGFIANRFGMWSMFQAVHSAEKLHMTAEQVDAITGPFLGRPRSASFRLNDIVGLDIMLDIAANLKSRCAGDPHMGALRTPTTTAALVERGWIGDKAGQGYYKREGKELVALDFTTLAYRMRQEPNFASLNAVARKPLGERVAEVLRGRDEVGEYLRAYLIPTLQYANYLKEEISHNVQDFDRVMKWGFGWEMGPFEMIDAIGPSNLEISEKPFYEGGQVRDYQNVYFSPPAEPQYRSITDFPIISSHENFTVRDLDHGVTAVAFSTKMGTINGSLVQELAALLSETKIGRLLLTSEARSYSAGYDLTTFDQCIANQNFAAIDGELIELQKLSIALGTIPSVAAIYGHCLGAGLELAMGCTRIVALAETAVGLPEAKVGLIPGGSGTCRMRMKFQADGAKGLAEEAVRLTQGIVSSNAVEAQKLGFLSLLDTIEFHPDRLLDTAKKVLLAVEVETRDEWKSVEGPLIGMIDRAQDELRNRGELTDHDDLIGKKIKHVFSKPTDWEDALIKEREAFIELCRTGLTHARIKHMLETGKPLKN